MTPVPQRAAPKSTEPKSTEPKSRPRQAQVGGLNPAV